MTPASVVEEAARLSDEAGYAQLTLATVAKRLGVATPSLYKHVDGLEGLRSELRTRSARELGDVLGRAVLGRSGPDALRAMARAYRRYALEHPGRYAALQRAPEPGDGEGLAAAASTVEVIVAALRGFDLPEDSVVDAIRTLRSALHGFVDLESQGGFGMPQDIEHSFEVMVEGFVRVFRTWPEGRNGTVR
ncbi:TetR/AcrR family transcriptional regulator [Actinorugispora endophytica]|uniref:TetR family transcriptional regulator n=1 Tax=Actinorugispora endophytica TaxID=1605990 RepID=A0A4R6UF86_9ACTN|nr:TetR/AcrR family transcriptional regulator [Actinorugispora endophytica]TDQ45421.1 TetR family transcriptional regulator [Actinorugispora endophytica]